MPKTTPAYLIVWGCHCHDVQVDPDNLPERCPGHDKPRINSPELLDVWNQYVGKHGCDEAFAAPCSEAVAS